jgi:hypothetical protein
VKPPEKVKTESVESSDPDRCGIRPFRKYPVRQLGGGLVRKGKDEYASCIDSRTEQPLNSTYERLSLAGTRPGFYEIGLSEVVRGGFLIAVQRLGRFRRRFFSADGRQQQSIQKLLNDDWKWCQKSCRDGGRCRSLFNMKPPNQEPRKKKLAGEDVSLNLSTLAPTVIDHPLSADRRGFRCPRGIGTDGY